MQTILAILAALLLLILLYKIIKVHLLIFQIESRLRNQQKDLEMFHQLRRDVAGVYTQVQAYLDLRSLLALEQPLPPLRGWAASPDFLLELAKHSLRHKPKVTVECSSGASTIVLARCCQLNQGGHVFSLEHDSFYAAKTSALLADQGLRDWATVIIAPLIHHADHPDTPWYDLSSLSVPNKICEMLVVDGPPGGDVVRARYPALPMLMPHMTERCDVFLDDASRSDEQEIVSRWIDKFPEFKATQLDCEKGCTRLTRTE